VGIDSKPSTPDEPNEYPPPGGYFDGNGNPLVFPPGQGPGKPGQIDPGTVTGPVGPDNPGGSADARGKQRSYPALGTAMGAYQLLMRGAPIQPNVRDPRTQFEPYTKDERKAYDQGPVALKVDGFVETSGGQPSITSPKCGPSDYNSGSAPHGGVSFEVSDSDLNQRLRGELTTPNQPVPTPTNTGLVNHGKNVDGSFGDINGKGLPANGFRYGRSYNAETGDKFASVDETGADGATVGGDLAVLVDFALQTVYLWGQPIVTGTPGGNGSVNRKPTDDVTIGDGYSLVVADYYDISTHTLTLDGDAALAIV
jgi:hypothetical protein